MSIKWFDVLLFERGIVFSWLKVKDEIENGWVWINGECVDKFVVCVKFEVYVEICYFVNFWVL